MNGKSNAKQRAKICYEQAVKTINNQLKKYPGKISFWCKINCFIHGYIDGRLLKSNQISC